MANKKISQLTAAGALTGAELLEGVQSAASVKLTTAAVAALAPATPSNRLVPAGGTVGQALAKVDATDYNVSWQTISGGGGGAGSFYYVGSQVLGAAATSISIGSLNLDADNSYRISVESSNATGSQMDAALFFNADFTATNYDSQLGVIDNAFAGAARTNTSNIGSFVASGPASWLITIRRGIDGRVRSHWQVSRGTSAGGGFSEEWGTTQWRTASVNVTGITITAATAGGLAAGTVIKVWKILDSVVAPPPSVALPGTTPDLVGWYKTDPILVSSGGSLPYLQNFCPWMPSLSAAASNGGATRSATQLNLQNVLAFPGNSTGRYPLAAGLSLPKLTIFVVLKPTNFTAPGVIIGGGTGAPEVSIDITTGKLLIVKALTAVIATATTGFTANTWSQQNATYDSATGAYAFRASQAANGSGTNAVAFTANSAGLFYNPGSGTQDVLGSFAELIIYNRVLTSPEILAIESYLNLKWGV